MAKSTASRDAPSKIVSFSDLAEASRTKENLRRKEQEKMATLPNGEIYAMNPHLAALAALDVPAKTGIHVARLVKRIGNAVKEIEEARMALISKLGEKDENGQVKLYPPNNPEGKPASANWDQFLKEYNELMEDTTDIESKPVIFAGDAKVPVALLLTFERFVQVEGEAEDA